MISLYAESPLCTFALILYTCVWIPLFHITQPFIRFFSYLWNPHQLPDDSSRLLQGFSGFELDLPVLKFQDLACTKRKEKMNIDDEEQEECSICLMEFEKEDLINKLPRCRHVFHKECMEKWLDRCQFTCPLCRSMVFPVASSSAPCNLWDSPFCVLPPAHD